MPNDEIENGEQQDCQLASNLKLTKDRKAVSHLSVKVADLNTTSESEKKNDKNYAAPTNFSPLRTGRGQDITDIFTRASNALHHGQLVKDEFFTLFESVAALELMDPKMDSGYSLPEKDAIVEDFDPLMYTLPEEILWIMDELLCFEMVWHDGYPLSQTLFASLHLNSLLASDCLSLESLVFRTHFPATEVAKHPLVTRILRAYCLGVVKCCDCVIREIASEHFYEEEDFITANFTRDLLTRIPEELVTSLLEEAIAEVKHMGLPQDFESAFETRLKCRLLMLNAFRPLTAETSSGKSSLFRSIKELIPSLDTSHKLCRTPQAPVFSERVQRHLASNTPPRPIKETSWQDAHQRLLQICNDVVAAFEISKLAPGFAPLALLVSPSNRSMSSILTWSQRFAWAFTSRKPQPLTYSRAVMQGLLFKGASVLGQLPHADLILNDIRLTVLPASDLLDQKNWSIELPSSPRYEIARKIDDFIVRSLDEYLHLYRMPLQNRCRIRRNFAQSIGILDSLQAMAEEYDGDIIGYCWASQTTREPIPVDEDSFFPLAAWVYHHKLQIMQIVVQMGFELELYLSDELASSYALLAGFAETHLEHCATIISVLETRLSPPIFSRCKPPPAAGKREIALSISFLDVQASQSRARSTLSSALADLYSLLALLGLLSPSRGAQNHSTQAMRHELRLKPFLPVGTPALPTHDQLAAATTSRPPHTKLADIRAAADAKLRIARAELSSLRNADPDKGRFKGVEAGWREEIKMLTHVAVAVAVSLAALADVWGAAGVETLSDVSEDVKADIRGRVKVDVPLPTEAVHPWWIVPKVTAVKK
ncbi:hypothetical protein ANO11243_016700 [Dothideomycetidae sp. 11243]|nr:hypothetical protein ANO11243_016700 [fungal sp. No.11243]